ncbi:MAG TPA: hypothetical protein VEQ59_00585, partial [Polyangiaceae bacterium]|nr:hypothetical protein [Polyangiaceae bacterium]
IVAKQKDIARYVTELFADTRAQLKALVERQLTLIQSDNSSISRERAPLGTPSPNEQSQSVNTKLAEQPAAAPGSNSGGKTWLMVGLGVVALLGIGFMVLGKTRAEEPRAQPVTPVAPNTTTVAAAAPTRASITFKASPTEAKLFLDGEALPSNPTTKLIAVDGKAHVLRAEANGFAEATTEFSPSHDATVSVALVPMDRVVNGNDAEGSSSSRKNGRSGRAPVVVGAKPPVATPVVAAPPTQAPKANCDSPFFLDKDGIRRVRPECR